MFGKHKKPKIKEPMVFPITKSIRYKSNLNPDAIKRQIVQKMLDEIMLYTEFSLDDMADGTILMAGRLNVIFFRDEEKEGSKEDDKSKQD